MCSVITDGVAAASERELLYSARDATDVRVAALADEHIHLQQSLIPTSNWGKREVGVRERDENVREKFAL